MKTKILSLLAVALAAAVIFTYRVPIADAVGNLGVRNVERELRTQAITVVLPVPGTAADTTDTTGGRRGVIGVTTIDGVAAPSITGDSLFRLPFPCKVDVILKDGGDDSTLTCASVTVRGRNQFGVSTSETISTISETAAESARVYEEVTSITGATCDGANAADDVLRVSCSNEIGLPYRINTADAILSLCFNDESEGADEAFCYRPNQLTVDLDDESVETDNLTGATPAFTVAAGDVVTIRVRPPSGL